MKEKTMMINYQQQFKALEKNVNALGQPWLQQLRLDAFARFEKTGFPTVKNENWKYTNTDQITNRTFNAVTKKTELTDQQIDDLSIPQLECYQLVFVNGVYHSFDVKANLNSEEYTESKKASEDIIIQKLTQALQQDHNYLKNDLAKQSCEIQHGFAALNTALMQDGAFIKIPANCKIEKPIHLLFITTNDDSVNYPRNLIIAENNSQATVIESYISLNATNYFSNAITEIVVQQGAKLDHIKLQQEDEQAFHIATTQVQQHRDSEFNSHVISLGGALTRSDINISLDEQGANCSLYGMYIGRGKQHMDHHTRVDHLQPHGTSREVYKGILEDSSRAVFNGQVYVHPNAVKTNAQQTNNNLLLSDKAEIDTKPQLEIYNDDVKCTHGATIGQLDQTQLFYLKSRGIDNESAKIILKNAFACEVTNLIANEKLKLYLQHLVLQKLSTDQNSLRLP